MIAEYYTFGIQMKFDHEIDKNVIINVSMVTSMPDDFVCE